MPESPELIERDILFEPLRVYESTVHGRPYIAITDGTWGEVGGFYDPGTRYAYMMDLGVLEEAHGNGLGTALVRAFAAEVKTVALIHCMRR